MSMFILTKPDRELRENARLLMQSDLANALLTGKGLYCGNFAKAVWQLFYATQRP